MRRSLLKTLVLAPVATVALSACNQKPEPLTSPRPLRGDVAGATSSPSEPRLEGVLADCSMRSEAVFPRAFRDSRNLVVGPLVLVGGGKPTPAHVVREFGGQKFPLLVQAGHTVTVHVPEGSRATAGLGYGPLPQGQVRLRDTHQTVTFVACSADEPSYSHLNRTRTVGPVTFWSGFLVTRAPICLPLDVYVDEERSPRRAVLALGSSSCGAPAMTGLTG